MSSVTLTEMLLTKSPCLSTVSEDGAENTTSLLPTRTTLSDCKSLLRCLLEFSEMVAFASLASRELAC
jgi:hypothetical protein